MISKTNISEVQSVFPSEEINLKILHACQEQTSESLILKEMYVALNLPLIPLLPKLLGYSHQMKLLISISLMSWPRSIRICDFLGSCQ